MLEVNYAGIEDSVRSVGIVIYSVRVFYIPPEKYNLINCFEADFKAGRKNEEYAKRVGMVEFVIGIAVLVAGIVLIIFT